MKRFVLWILIFSLLTIPVLADELEIKDVDAIVNGIIINNIDESQNSLEVKSGDRVDLTIEFENEHSPSTNIDIEILDLFVSLDDNNLVSESMNFDIDAGEEVTRKVSFTIPNLKENLYTLKIEVEGRDDDNHIQEDIEFINLFVMNNENLFVQKIKKQNNPKQSEVTLQFVPNQYSNVKNNDSEFPYLLISLILFIMFIFILLILLMLNKSKK